MDWAELGRWTNVLLAVICLVFLGRKAFLYWGRYQSRTKDFWWVLTLWCFVIIFGSFEVLMGWDTQIRVLFTTLALLLTIKVIARRNEADNPVVTKEL